MARRLSQAYRRAALTHRALIADVGQRSCELSGTQALYAADGVHPNACGSRLAAETIATIIQQHKEEQL